jgi:hypothetical protein
MASPYAQVADALKAIIDTEFAPEAYTALHDNLHPAVGQEGTRIGIAPEVEEGRAGRTIQNDISLTVKFYRRWDAQVDENKKVDPRVISEFAERFRQAIRDNNQIGTDSAWYFNLVRIRYPNDPTGNKTRFEADLVAYGTNSALTETTS